MMIEMIDLPDHKIAVRDDLMEGRVACIHCKGRGYKWRTTGMGFGLWSQYYESTAFSCSHCAGDGHWQERPS